MLSIKPSTPAVAYRRVSTEHQGRSGVGLEGQLAGIVAFARATGCEIVGDYPEVLSGRLGIGLRLGLRSAFQHAKEVGGIVVLYDISRLSRDSSAAEEIVRNAGVSVVSVSDGDPGNAIMLGKVARAEKERELISQRTKDALQKRKDAGVLLGNRTNLDEAQQLGASGNVLAKRQKALEILDVLLKTGITKNSTAQATADALNENSVYTRQGKRWNKSNVRVPAKEAWLIHDEDAKVALSRNPNYGRFA